MTDSITLQHLICYANNPLRANKDINDIWDRYEASRYFQAVYDGKLSLSSLDKNVAAYIVAMRSLLDPTAHLFEMAIKVMQDYDKRLRQDSEDLQRIAALDAIYDRDQHDDHGFGYGW